MPTKLPTICTKTGDEGTTSLRNGKRISKDHPCIEACGTIDELSASIGLLRSHKNIPKNIQDSLNHIQNELFEIGTELSIENKPLITSEHINQLEKELSSLDANLTPLKNFILPDGKPAQASCHMVRTICRRAERRMITLSHHQTVNPFTLQYLNRLSDLLFVMARILEHTKK